MVQFDSGTFAMKLASAKHAGQSYSAVQLKAAHPEIRRSLSDRLEHAFR